MVTLTSFELLTEQIEYFGKSLSNKHTFQKRDYPKFIIGSRIFQKNSSKIHFVISSWEN